MALGAVPADQGALLRHRLLTIAWFTLGIVAMSSLGAYGASIGAGERGSFVMNFPATGAESGGPSPRSLTGEVTVSIDQAGFIKKTLQPNVVQIASHSIKNVGDVPRTISFETSGFPEATEWSSRDLAWDSKTRTIRRAIAPGQYVDLDLEVAFDKPLPSKSTLLNGYIYVKDAKTGERLSSLLVRVVRGPAFAAGGDCCE